MKKSQLRKLIRETIKEQFNSWADPGCPDTLATNYAGPYDNPDAWAVCHWGGCTNMLTDCSGQEISRNMGSQIIQSGTVQGYNLDLSCCTYGPNTNPGLTEESILPQQAKAANISLKDLFRSVIDNNE